MYVRKYVFDNILH